MDTVSTSVDDILALPPPPLLLLGTSAAAGDEGLTDRRQSVAHTLLLAGPSAWAQL